MNRTAQLGLYRISEDLGSIIGVPLGIITGFGKACWIPTYIRQQLTTSDPHNFSYGRWTIYGIEKIIHEQFSPKEQKFLDTVLPPSTTDQKIRDEAARRFNTTLYASTIISENISKYGWLTLAAYDWVKDGKPDILGYILVPIVISLIYEVGRLVLSNSKGAKSI